jgi:hypothetical protein
MSVSLSIAFTGLCALIADGNGAPGQVLLLDAQGVGQVGGVTLPAHAPSLVVSLRDLANPESSGPTQVIGGTPNGSSQVEQLGVWDLTGSEVRIRAQGIERSGLQLFKPSRTATSWPKPPQNPNDPAAWRDLRFVADMATLAGDGRIDPALLGGGDASPAALPRAVAARIHLDAGLLEAAMPSQSIHREDMFEFRSVGSERTLRQALTDTVQWTLKADTAAIVIDIVPAGGGPTKRLLLAPSAVPHRVFISNLPAANAAHGDALHAMSDEQVGALHFGAYYKLLLEQPALVLLPTPARDVRKGAGLIRNQFCPAARFSRP